MNNIRETITKIEQLLPQGVVYPEKLLAKHDKNVMMDREHYGYLTKGGEAGGYFHWLTLLMQNSDAKLVLELGNRYGSSTIALYQGLKENQKVITVDIEKDQRYVPDEIMNDSRIKFVFGDCLNLNTYLKNNETVPIDIDVLWTDTVHFYEQLSAEFKVYEPLLADEALIIIDDIKLNDKGRFFQESPFEKYDLTDICHVSGFGAIHYKRDEKDRGKTYFERVNQALFNANEIWFNRHNKLSQEFEKISTQKDSSCFIRKLSRLVKH